MSLSAPIGVFDSGLGGLSVLKTMCKLLPDESFIYVGDHNFLPYGEKSDAQILQRSLAIADFLIYKNAKALVIACNTATAVAVNEMRQQLTLPIIAMEPAVKLAVSHSNSGKIGVLATTGTLGSNRFYDLIKRVSGATQIITQACSGLVEAIENAGPYAPETNKLVHHYTQALLDQNVDAIVLGCTHYSLVRESIEKLAGTNTIVLDAGAAVAQQLARQLTEQHLLSKSKPETQLYFYTSGTTKLVHVSASRLWGCDITMQKLPEQYCRTQLLSL